jgi:hypothetical protein
MEDKLNKLVEELILFSDNQRDTVNATPKTEVERGFKIATLVICTKLKKLAHKYAEKSEDDNLSYTMDELKEILSRFADDNEEE